MSKVKEKPIRLPKLVFCPLCGGSGLVDNGNETKECPLCKGKRVIR